MLLGDEDKGRSSITWGGHCHVEVNGDDADDIDIIDHERTFVSFAEAARSA